MNRVAELIDDAATRIRVEIPKDSDPLVQDVLDLILDVSQMAGARLLEPRFGSLTPAGAEILAYLEHVSRVQRVSVGSPFHIPAAGVRTFRVSARIVEHTDHVDDVIALVIGVCAVVDAVGDSVLRYGGRDARPLENVFDLARRSGPVYRDSLSLVLPPT
ncbi:MAG: hypothetical protein ACK5LO_13670 [Leucobacter sp.]